MSAVGRSGLLIPVFAPVTALTLAYTGRKLVQMRWRAIIKRFFTGPGRVSRILLLVFVLTNRKNLLFGWTVRIFAAMFRHVLLRRGPLPHRSLFSYSITSTHAPLLETDYNIHKSNSTYFSDMDTSRTHLVMHLFGPGMKAVGENSKTHLVKDKEGKLIKGGFGIGLGSVFCSFRKEIAPYQGYEMWSRVLAWDRKWLYIVTHFVMKGKAVPASWDGGCRFAANGKTKSAGKGKCRGSANGVVSAKSGEEKDDLEKYVIATAVSKYVFKLGRFTVHPAIIMQASGLLPERPGDGWRGGETETGTPEDLSAMDADEGSDAEWDWRRTEWERRKGMAFAEHFAALDEMHAVFDGSGGALGRFRPG